MITIHNEISIQIDIKYIIYISDKSFHYHGKNKQQNKYNILNILIRSRIPECAVYLALCDIIDTRLKCYINVISINYIKHQTQLVFDKCISIFI